MKYRNAILLIAAVILFAYASFISIFPAILTSVFNVEKFEKELYASTNLVTTVDAVNFKIKPNLDMVITINNWSTKWIENQDCFDAGVIQLTTGPFCIFTKNFKIKDLYLKRVKYLNQVLDNGINKLEYLPASFNSEVFGAKKITVISGPVRVKSFKIKTVTPSEYNETYKNEVNFSEENVRNFLLNYLFSGVVIK